MIQMRSKILIFSILEILLAVDDLTDMSNGYMPLGDMSDGFMTLEDMADLEDMFLVDTTPIMPAWETTTEHPEDPTTERVITILDQMEKIENHRGKFISLFAIRS